MRRRRVSEATRRKMSIAHKGERNGMFGKHHTPEAKGRIRIGVLKSWRAVPMAER